MKKLSPPTFNLEDIFNKSKTLDLPETCKYIITKNKAIPYHLFSETLGNYGICILTLNYKDNSKTFQEIIKNLGTLHTHKEEDSFLWDIKVSDAQAIARSHKDHEFHFHTDCSYEENVPDYFALYVLHADQKSGGKNLIVVIKSVIGALSKESLKTLQSDPVTIKVPQEFYKGIASIQACIIDENNNIRYRREIIDSNHLTSKQVKAIGELERLVYSPEFCRGLILSDDQILILSNKKYLHARTHIKDPERHLQRIRFFKASPTIASTPSETKQESPNLNK
jgi:alpha-ketoglutarate-dependent taurine dioxygenase